MENDLISRKSLMEKIDHWASQVKGGIHHTDRIVWDVLEGVTDTICDEEAVEAEPKWISVKERLPEANEDVAIIYRMGDCTYLRIGWLRKTEMRWMQAGLGVIEGTVTHWMPLPEPPKDGGAE